jgi:hypothetical protein
MDPNERKERQQHFDSRLQSQDETHPGWKDAWLTFCHTLLEHGGAIGVPPPTPDPLLGMLQERGTVHHISRVIHIVGEQSACHRNVAALWRSGQAISTGTGYALSEDEIWREHSWAWDHEGRLIETTEIRCCYFGVRFEGPNCQWFIEWVDPS